MRLARYVSRGKRQSQAERKECQLVMIYKRIDAFFGNIELEDRAITGRHRIRLHAGNRSLAVIDPIEHRADDVRRSDSRSHVHEVHAHQVARVDANRIVIEPPGELSYAAGNHILNLAP